jgi:hypothetical protein
MVQLVSAATDKRAGMIVGFIIGQINTDRLVLLLLLTGAVV